MKTSDFYYDLPKELIAQTPLENRTDSRLLVLDKETGEIQHRDFTSILDFLSEGDALVLNETKVLPVRLLGQKESGGKIEAMLLTRRSLTVWEAIGRNLKVGSSVVFGEKLSMRVLEILDSEGLRLVEFDYDGVFEELLHEYGTMPIPPYIKESLQDKDRYNTVYAKNVGSSAAPTAGLHFTEELLEKATSKGVNIVKVTLQVGRGTFLPVKVSEIENHKMHSEEYYLSEHEANRLNLTREAGKNICCVGTTSVRVLETVYRKYGEFRGDSGATDIFIYPGERISAFDMLITNFHLPESTLIMLVSAFAGKENTFRAYKEAVDREYRFFSFGDAMLIK